VVLFQDLPVRLFKVFLGYIFFIFTSFFISRYGNGNIDIRVLRLGEFFPGRGVEMPGKGGK